MEKHLEKHLEKQIKELQNAIKNFTDSLSLNCNQYDIIAQDTIKSGQVQKFEFCVELYWKTLKRFIQDTHGFVLKSPKAVIKKGLDLGFYDYKTYETAIGIINWRNELSHIYKQESFGKIRILILNSRSVWKTLLTPFVE